MGNTNQCSYWGDSWDFFILAGFDLWDFGGIFDGILVGCLLNLMRLFWNLIRFSGNVIGNLVDI